MPFTPASRSRSTSLGRLELVASRGSWAAIASSTIAASSTDRVNGPIWSRLDANAMRPYRLTRPYVGFMPTTPHRAGGWRVAPPVRARDASAMSPYRLTRPYVGFMPTTPHRAAGWRIEPPVSVPNAIIASPDATAAALPPELPPGTRSRSQGLCVG